MYQIDTDSEALEQIAALPTEALSHYAQVLGVLELAPWNGIPYNKHKPDGIMRTLLFGDGRGKVTYLILEDQRRVDVLKVCGSTDHGDLPSKVERVSLWV